MAENKFDGDYFGQDRKVTPSNGGEVRPEGGIVMPVPGGFPGDPSNEAPAPARDR